MLHQGRCIAALFFLACVPHENQVRAEAAPPALEGTAQETGTPLQDDAHLHDVQFINARVGWAVGDRGVIWKTEDAGRRWHLLESGVDCPLRSVCFLTDRVGWVVGGGTAPYTRLGYGVVLFTDDGGTTWERLSPDPLPRLHAVEFFGRDEGVVVGDATPEQPTGILVTQDGGQHWQGLDGPRGRGWRAADFLSVDEGAVAGMEGRVSVVGGKRLLAPRLQELGLRGLRDVALQVDQTGWLVGDGGLVLFTASGGVVWESPATPLPTALREVSDFRAVACRGQRVWIGGRPGGVVWHSPDGGRSWSKQLTGQPQPIHALHFQPDGFGWGVGALGTVIRTEDGGNTWEAVRGAGRRVALMCIHARPQQVSMNLVAEQAGEWGYRTAVLLPARRDVGPDGHASGDLDVRLHEAVTSAGGSVGEIGWRLPIDVPGLERNAQRLVEQWKQQTDDRLREVFLSDLVGQIRTWRPSVLVVTDPAPDDAATSVLNDAVLRAVTQAADSTRFIRHNELGGLQPWTVRKVYLGLPKGSSGDVRVNAYEVLTRTGRTVKASAAEAYAMLRPDPPPRHEALRLIQYDLESNVRQVSAGGIWTGIPLATGSVARRRLDPLDESESQRLQRIADRQRNFQAYKKRYLEEPHRAAQLIGEIDTIIRDLREEEAAGQLAELARDYRRLGRHELVEATLIELVKRFPHQPVAHDGMRWLLQLWGSAEVAWQRSRQIEAVRGGKTTDRQAVLDGIEEAIRQARENPLGRLTEASSAESIAWNVEADESSAARETEWRRGAVRHWRKQSLKIAELIHHQSPSLFRSPPVAFPLAAVLRQRGAYNAADRIYRRYQRSGEGDPWRQTALGEIWLWQQVQLPPKTMVTCRMAPGRPVLDGVLSDPCWQQAVELRLTSEDDAAGSDTLEPAEDPSGRHSFALLSFDEQFLYFGASIRRRDGTPADGPQLNGRRHDADLAGFDRISLFLDLDRDYATYYALHVDQRGWTSEACWQDAGWNPQWFVAADADDTHWRIEVAIAINELAPRAPRSNDVWAVGITRTIPAVAVESWTHPASSQPRPETFGLLRFE